MKAIYKMNFDCGRMGSLQGAFVAEKEHVEILIKHEIPVYFGEVLGKHSEVYGSVSEKEIRMISDNELLVQQFIDNKLHSGYNPFHYTSVDFEHESIDDIEDMEIQEICEKIFNQTI